MNDITVLSTFAEDKIIDNNKIIKTQKGGPAFYILNVFQKTNLSIEIIKGPILKIEMILKKEGEAGKVKTGIKVKKINFSKIKSQFIIISTILNEFDLSGISTFSGKIFLDIQGYVRKGEDLGGKKKWIFSKEIFSSIFCLKGTQEEIRYLQKDFLKEQKKKILIVTNGKIGCTIFAFEKKYEIKNIRKVNAPDTIGAGDTFFAHFIYKFIKTSNVVSSGRYAVAKTSNFLEYKKQ